MARTTKTNKATANITLNSDLVSIEVRPFEKDNLLGFATLTIYGFIKIYNCTIVKGKNGAFLSFPSYKGSDGKYYSHTYVDKNDDDGKMIYEEIATLLDKEYNN